jgi:hypothetical protein
MKSYPSHEVLLTTPDLPLGESFTSVESNDTDSLFISYDECEEIQKRPYIFHVKESLNKNLHDKPIEEHKDSVEITETTDISRGTKKEIKVATSRNTQCRTYYSSNFLHKQKKHRDSYKLLRMYWKEKERIEDKYKKMISDIEKEAAINSVKKSPHSETPKQHFNTSCILESIEDLRKLQDYYEDSKSLLNVQRVMEQEELLKEFQKKTFI